MDEPDEHWSRLTIAVRADDLDVNAHVRGPAYVAYADHARWALVDAAGVDLAAMAARRIGPVNLETTVRFHRELRAGDEVEVRTSFRWTPGRTGRVRQHLRLPDGTLVAEVTSISGMLDLDTRRLLPEPDRFWRELARDPALLGVGDAQGV